MKINKIMNPYIYTLWGLLWTVNIQEKVTNDLMNLLKWSILHTVTFSI